MFRNFIFLAMAVGAATMAGWLSIDREGDQTTIKINKAEIRSDTRRAITRGREYLDEREQGLASRQDSEFSRGRDDYGQQSYRPQTYPAAAGDRQYQYPADRYQTERYQTQPFPATSDSYDRYDQVQYREAGYQRPPGVYRGQSNQSYQNEQDR